MTLAYFFFRSTTLGAPLVWLINILLVCVFALIIWEIIKWVASEFGVPAKIIHLVGLLIFLGLLLTLFAGCSTTTTTFPDGRVVKTSSQDPAVVSVIVSATVDGAVRGGLGFLESRSSFAK